MTAPSKNGHKTEARAMPHDVKAERALLGALLIDPAAIYEVEAELTADDFYLEANKLIYVTMRDLAMRRDEVDIITVAAELRKHGHAIGDGQDRAEVYLIGLMTETPTSVHATHYAAIVAKTAQRRRIIRAANAIATEAWDESNPLDEVADTAQRQMFDAVQRRTVRGLAHIAHDVSMYLDDVDEARLNPVGVSGVQTGYHDLDRLIDGLHPQQMIVVAGRPGMGKTALMVGMADMMSVGAKLHGAFFNLEMSKRQLVERIIARRTQVNPIEVGRGNVSDSQHVRLTATAGKVAEAPLFIDDRPALTPAEIRAQCLRQAASTGLDYVLIDYLQLIRVPGNYSRYEAVSTAARFVKNLAKELEAPVIVAAQLNRSVEQRSDKRPALSDLRDSGEIEEAANKVLILYRSDYYKSEHDHQDNTGNVIVAKNREGRTGQVNLFWHKQTASYRELAKEEVQL